MFSPLHFQLKAAVSMQTRFQSLFTAIHLQIGLAGLRTGVLRYNYKTITEFNAHKI